MYIIMYGEAKKSERPVFTVQGRECEKERE